MIDKENIIKLIADIESDRAERTLSTTNTDKFGQAICAFASLGYFHRNNHCKSSSSTS